MQTAKMVRGMGAILCHDGVFFRVWAPHATKISVVGTFNGWKSRQIDRLKSEDNGYWAGQVDGVKVGDEYLYEITNETTFNRQDPYSRLVTGAAGNSVVYDPEAYQWKSSFQPPTISDMVVYELHIGSFFTGTKKQRHRSFGTFDNAIQKLDYLKHLGINVIELLPVHQFPGSSNWGYSPSNIFAVANTYGGPDKLKAFVDAAHENGIAVVLDVVYNHLGPSDTSVWRFDEWYENDGGGIYFYQDDRSATPWTQKGRPDYGRAEVRQYIRDNVEQWLTEFRMDGVRVDSVSYMRNVNGVNDSPDDNLPEAWSLLQWINEEIDKHSPDKISIAEDLHDNEAITEPTSNGGLGFDTQWDMAFCETIRSALVDVDDNTRSISSIKDSIEKCQSGRATSRVIFTESHDVASKADGRLSKSIDPKKPFSYFARKRASLGAVIGLTAPGIPMLLQGQEFLERQSFDSDRPLDWKLLKQNEDTHLLFTDLIALRKNLSGTSKGLTGKNTHVFHVNEDTKVLAYLRNGRGGKGDDVIVVINLRCSPVKHYKIGLPNKGTWVVRFNSDSKIYGADYMGKTNTRITASAAPMDGLPFSGALDIGPYSAMILSQVP